MPTEPLSIGDVTPISQEMRPPPIRIVYAAASVRGAVRPHNEDGFVTPQSQYLPDYETDTQLEDLVNQLTGRNIRLYGEEVTVTFTKEHIRSLGKRIQKLIESGVINGFALVADGMGGYAFGELAASMGLVVVTDEVVTILEKISVDDPDKLGDTQFVGNVFQRAVIKADKVIVAADHSMGMTFAGVLQDKTDTAHCIRVGDARIYERDSQTGRVLLVTPDNTWVWSFLENNILKSPSGLFTNPTRNIVGNHVGSGELSVNELFFETRKMSAGKQLILVSDGSWEEIPQTEETNKILAEIDEQFIEKIKAGTDRNQALLEAFGEIYRRINLRGVAPRAQAQELVNTLVPDTAGTWSHDNVTAVVMENVAPDETAAFAV